MTYRSMRELFGDMVTYRLLFLRIYRSWIHNDGRGGFWPGITGRIRIDVKLLYWILDSSTSRAQYLIRQRTQLPCSIRLSGKMQAQFGW